MIATLKRIAGPGVASDIGRNISFIVLEAIIAGGAFVLLVPILRSIIRGDNANVWSWWFVLATTLAVYAVLRFNSQVAGYQIAVRTGEAIFSRLGQHIPRLPLGWFDATKVGYIGRLSTQGVMDVIGIPAHLMRPLITGIVTPATVILVMVFFDWRLALAAIACVPVAFVTHRWAAGFARRSDERNHRSAAEAAGRIVEYAQSQDVFRAFGREGEGARKLDDAIVEQHRAGRAQIFGAGTALSLFALIIQFGFVGAILFGTHLALGGEIDAAELVVLLVLLVRFVEPMLTAASVGSALQIGRNSLERTNRLLSHQPLPEPDRSRGMSGSAIKFENVRFAYNDIAVVNGISFEVDQGTTTAIVGPSGAGKTTLLKLLARFWDVSSGTIRIGGADIRELSAQDLMAQLTMVFQDVYLIDGTIAENIRMGRPTAVSEDIECAARQAQVLEFVDRLPNGIDSQVGEGGTKLSGGERQRVSIARALLKDAPIVLLDEATSALDPINEAAITAGLRSLQQDKTTIVVAHRLHTIRRADQILFLESGKIVERGTHKELMAANGRYSEFWHSRMRASSWKLKA
ncbi:MAG: ABC transporter ATP-binding protein [Pseudomonadota bacterium]